MFDRWAFGLRKVDGGGGADASGSGSLASPPSSVRENSADDKVHAVEVDLVSERIVQLLRNPSFDENNTLPGSQKPSAPPLSQQAPNHGREATAQRILTNGSDDGISTTSSGAGSSVALDPRPEAVDRITVKIADLGNGEHSFPVTVAH